jgi:hypothetical protein
MSTVNRAHLKGKKDGVKYLYKDWVTVYRADRLEAKATPKFCLKGFNSTGSIAMKIIIIQLIDFSESRYGLKASEFR